MAYTHEMRSLVLENSRVYRQLLHSIMEEHGFHNDICNNISEARKLVEVHAYDIICISHHLEDGKGTDFVQYCNGLDINNSASILYFTSEKKIDELLKSLRVNEIIFKNNSHQIADQINRFIEVHYDVERSNNRVMFVEDSKTYASIIMPQLKSAGYRVEHFVNADGAWDSFKSETAYGSDLNAYDLIITDINLEGKMSGLQLVSKIRGLVDARGFIPIIAMTGDNSDELRLSLYENGISDFVQKPILAKELLIRMTNLITSKQLLDKVHDQRRELFTMATTDKLTGCHNRHSLVDFASKIILQARRHDFPVSLLVIDLDHFKVINDTHGHATGDLVLQSIGGLLNGFFRDSDLVARFGGEEFVALLDHCDDKEALQKAELLRKAIENLKPEDLVVTASIGVTTKINATEGDFDTIFAAADKGVYMAKENGRNRVEVSQLETT